MQDSHDLPPITALAHAEALSQQVNCPIKVNRSAHTHTHKKKEKEYQLKRAETRKMKNMHITVSAAVTFIAFEQ